MKTVNTHEAKTQLSRLLKRVAAGEEIVIARAGQSVARPVPIGLTDRMRIGNPNAIFGLNVIGSAARSGRGWVQSSRLA